MSDKSIEFFLIFFLFYSAAARGLTLRLTSYQLAGVDLNKSDYSGRTPLHAVS